MSTSKMLQHLYSLSTSSPDFLPHLDSLLQNDDEERYLSSLQGPESTCLVDFLDKVLDAIPNTNNISRRCLHKLQAICNLQRILPSSYNVSGNPTRVGRDAVASGGFSDVWEGIHNDKRVCIKCPRITQQNRLLVEEEFCKEAVMWRRFNHPNIVPFIGVTWDPLQFVSEWMPNGTLTQYLGKNSEVDRILLLLDIAKGLTFLHANYTTHGDLKGANILIDHDEHARLTDFTFSSVVRGMDSVSVTKVHGYTPRWAAPEVLVNGEKNTWEADVFAFGMVMIEVFTGKHPFSGFTESVTIAKIIDGERPDRPKDPDLTDSIWNVTLSCWQENPVKRPKMMEVVGTLHECYGKCTVNLDSSPLAPELLAMGTHDDTLVSAPPPSVDEEHISANATNGPGFVLAKQKEELQRYHTNLVFEPGNYVNVDLLNKNRLLIHTGNLLQLDLNHKISECFALLFDNYLVFTKPSVENGVTKYQVYGQPVPLDFLGIKGPDRNFIHPSATQPFCEIYHTGLGCDLHSLFTQSTQVGLEWRHKLDEAVQLRKVSQVSNEVFQVKPIIIWRTDGLESLGEDKLGSAHEVTCSVPFTASDGQNLVAIGSQRGMWIASRHSPQSMQQVPHLTRVTQCAILEDYGIFLVLADKRFYAYHTEALVNSSHGMLGSLWACQRIDEGKDVQCFAVSKLGDKTLVIYLMKSHYSGGLVREVAKRVY